VDTITIALFIFSALCFALAIAQIRYRKKHPEKFKKPERLKSHVEEATGRIILRSHDRTFKSGEEWRISGNSVAIAGNTRDLNGTKTIPISQLSGVALEEPGSLLGLGYLKLYIGGGRTSQMFLGTGGISGLANYSIAFDASDADIARRAHNHIAAQISK